MSDTLAENEPFDLTKYFEKIENIIENILSRHERNVLTFDILDTKKQRKNKMIVLKEKQRQMKIGEIWQEVLGNYKECLNLKTHHSSGLDILNNSKKFIVEVKNRTNTDNFSSRKTNFDKLAKFKKNNPSYTCIYACINDTTEEKTMKGTFKKIVHNGVEIELHTGKKFLNFIFGDDVDEIVNFVRVTIDKLT